MLDLRLAGARSEELIDGASRLMRDVLEVVERASFVLDADPVCGGLGTLLGPPSCSTAVGHDSMRLMRLLIAMRSSASMPRRRSRCSVTTNAPSWQLQSSLA